MVTDANAHFTWASPLIQKAQKEAANCGGLKGEETPKEGRYHFPAIFVPRGKRLLSLSERWAIERDLVAFVFAIMDAEDAAKASADIWGQSIADFAAHERIKLDPFRYSCDRPPKLLRKPWLDTGRNWPYCFAQLRKHDAWIPLGRNYKPLGKPLTPHGVSLTIPAHLTAFGWRRSPDRLWLFSEDPASRRDYFARVGRLIGLTVEPVATLRQLTGAGADPPPGAGVALAA